MATMTIALSDECLLELEEKATRLGVSPEELVRVSIEELLARPDEAFEQAVDYVLNKNAELYRRGWLKVHPCPKRFGIKDGENLP